MIQSIEELRQRLYAAVVSDALDRIGYRNQSPRKSLAPVTQPPRILIGRCKTTIWEDWDDTKGEDPNPYELELKAVDACQPDDVFVAAAGGSMRSGVWGELLTTAARNRGCVGAIIDGAVRDVTQISQMHFPVFAVGTSVYDSLNRQRVVDMDVPVEIDGVRFSPGDLVVADRDGIVVIPQSIEDDALSLAWEKVDRESKTREEIRRGMSATGAYQKYGVL